MTERSRASSRTRGRSRTRPNIFAPGIMRRRWWKRLLAIRVWPHHKRRLICDWYGIEAEETELRVLMAAAGVSRCIPSRSSARGPARPGNGKSRAPSRQVSWPRPSKHRREEFAGTRKLGIGYMPADLCRHATALLMGGLFERRDKSCFEIVAYSRMGRATAANSARGCARLSMIAPISARGPAARRRIKAGRIDILVELIGYTKGARTGIAARRPAPAQVSFAGFPGTMGAGFIDYVIGGPFVLPLDQQIVYSEKLGSSALLSAERHQEADFGHCAHARRMRFPSTNTYKITPEFFGIWMGLLTAIPGAVLWLLDANDPVKDSLRGEARARSVESTRLVFAPRLPSPEHPGNRLSAPLCDIARYTRHYEAALAHMWKTWANGHETQSFAVPP